jgi:hypothetical protein
MRHVVYCILQEILLPFCAQSVKGLEEFGVAWMYVAWWVLSGVGQAYEKLLLQLEGVIECNVINFCLFAMKTVVEEFTLQTLKYVRILRAIC